MPLNDRDRKALKVGGIVAAVLVLALVGLGQLGKGGAPALPPLSVGPSAAITANKLGFTEGRCLAE